MTRPLEVCFDLTSLSDFDGVGRWTRNIIPALVGAAPEWKLTVLVSGSGDLGPIASSGDVRVERVHGSARMYRLKALLGRTLDPRSLGFQADALVGPAFVTNGPKDLVQLPVLHDLAFLHHPASLARRNLLYLRTMVPRTVRMAKRVITVSETMRTEICEAYGCDEDRVDIVPGAPSLRGEGGPLPPGLSERPFLLWVGSLEPRKNLAGALAACKRAFEGAGGGMPLVVVGGSGWRRRAVGVDVSAEIATGALVHLGTVDDGTLTSLYRQAAALVFPSFYEGFGLPVVEAMSLGCPVVTSDLPVMREVAGSDAFYVDPSDPDSIAAGIRRAVARGRQEQVGPVQKLATRFSWDRSGALLKASIERAVRS